jgi:hypothetical protein
MWGPNDGMSPMNPFSAPNQLAQSERYWRSNERRLTRTVRFIERHNAQTESIGGSTPQPLRCLRPERARTREAEDRVLDAFDHLRPARLGIPFIVLVFG